MRRTRTIAWLAAAVLLVALVGCGGDRDAGERSGTTGGVQPSPSATAAQEGERSAALQRLAANVASYPAKARLIRLGPPALPALLTQAAGSDAELAAESSATIRWMVTQWKDDPEAAETMATQLADFTRRPTPAGTRAFAVDLLGDLVVETAVQRLTELLDDDELGATAVLALGRIRGPAARQALVGAIDSSSGERREALYAALGRRAETESIPLLLEAAAEDDAAVAALSSYDDPTVLDWLATAAEDGSDVALAALLATRAAASDGSLLARAAAAASGDERSAVAERVRAPEQYDPALVRELLDMPSRGAVGRARAKALLALADRLEPDIAAAVALEALSGHSDATVVVPAMRVCASVCPPAAAEEIGEALGSRQPKIRLAAVDALAKMPGERASIELRDAIAASDPAVARPMIHALGERRDTAAVDALLGLMGSPPKGLEGDLLAASLVMAPTIENQGQAARVWARSLDLEVTPEAIDGLGRVGGATEVPRLEKVIEGSAGQLYDATRDALVGVGRRLAGAGQNVPAIAALEVAFRNGAPVEGDLRRLGQRVELVAHGGLIDAWWLLAGIEAAPDCRAAGPPSTQIAALDAADGPDPWRPIESSDNRGAVELQAPGKRETPLWLAADVVPREDAPIGILVRSSAESALWLDGAALEPDPDDGREGTRYTARLTEGVHRILLRVCAMDGASLLAVQLEDESGRPLKFRIR